MTAFGKRFLSEGRLEGDYLGYWNTIGSNQFEFLQREGLKPHHFLLDVACGSFRAGRFFIAYLDKGHYYGIDRNSGFMKNGIKQVLQPQRLMRKNPHIHQVEFNGSPVALAETLGYDRFDYVWVHALFDHISHEMIQACLKDVKDVLVQGGRLYATIFLNPYGSEYREPILRLRNGEMDSPVTTYPDREHWHHSLDFFERAVSSIPGLILEACLDDYPHPLGLSVLRFIRT